MTDPLRTTFATALLALGNNTGIEVPAANVAELGQGKRPPVIVEVDGYTYRSTIAVMGGKNLLPFAKEHREASGFKGGDEVTVTLTRDDTPRTVEIPEQLRAALAQAGRLDSFEALSFSRRKEACRSVSDAKAEDTRVRRIARVLDSL
ncbi:MAG: YdeI/OmpD-associated family protein [Nocardioides sp.]